MERIASLKKLRNHILHVILPDSPSSSSVPFWEYLKWLRWTRFTPKFPRVIDIQTKSGCNARCSFCGVGREKNRIQGQMPDRLWKSIIDEILSHPKVRRIHTYLLNDPLIDGEIAGKLAYISEKKGSRKKPHIHFITNAGLLTEKSGIKLLETEAIHEFDISFISIQPNIYEKLMPPLKFENVMDNIRSFKKNWDDYPGKKPKLNIWTIRIDAVEQNLKNEKAYWKNLGFGFKARKFDNRADKHIEALGLVDKKFYRVGMCPIPFWRAWILFNGDMIMCCVDGERSMLLGNCENDTIESIWNGPNYNRLRKRWRKKQLEGLLCEKCRGT